MHSWGLPCEMDAISDWAKEKGLIVLEDAAHAHGASMQGKKMGTWGAMGIYSFQASKVLPCVEGGMGMYQTREYFERAAAFGDYDARQVPQGQPVRRTKAPASARNTACTRSPPPWPASSSRTLDERNADLRPKIRSLNDRLTQLPGLSEPRCPPHVRSRVLLRRNMLFLDEKGRLLARRRCSRP